MEIVEINPTDKAEEIKTLLMGLNSEVKTSTDEGYTWLQDHSICVIAHNPTHEKMLEIELEEQGKFSLFFGGHHCHYCADAEEYARLSGDIQAILENRLCAATICYGDKQWLGSRLVNPVQISFRVRHLRLNLKDVRADCLCQRLGNLRGHAGRRKICYKFLAHVFPLFSSHKSVYGQGQIPEGNCQLPDQNYAADQTAKDKVECDNTYCPGNAKANRNQREHLPNAKRHSASKPDQEIIGRSVFDENTAEHRKQKQRNHNRNDGLL